MIDDAVDRAWPELRGPLGLDARLVPQRRAAALGLLAPGERYVMTQDEMDALRDAKAELMTLLRAIGVEQTGGRVDNQWCFAAAAAIGLDVLGVSGWIFSEESMIEAIDAVSARAKLQYRHDRRDNTGDDSPF